MNLVSKASKVLKFYLNYSILIILITACGLTSESKRKLNSFGKITHTTSELASKEFLRMRDTTIQMNKERIVLKSPLAREPDQNDLDEKFDYEVIETRIRATNALKHYSEIISILVEESNTDGLIDSLENFFHELDQIQDMKYSKDNKEKLLASVQILGNILENYQKREFLKELIPKVDKEISTLCDLLSSEFDYKNSLKLGLAYQITTDRLFITADTAFLKAITKEEKKNALLAKSLANENKIRKINLFPILSQAFQEIKKSHSSLAKSLFKDETDLKELLKTARELKRLNMILGDKS
ncbi:MAG: hypothetical protein SFU98_15275 [Leptospiraceae bacterium]|nr:hypothetical protein [Leptospiraceae bacterium]